MTFSLGFVSFVFFSIENSMNAVPVVRFLLTILSGSLPKIIEIFQSVRQKNIEARKIFHRYKKIMTVKTEGVI